MTDLVLSEEGARFIACFEGFESEPYRCPAGKWTIGYGHVLQPGESFSTLSRSEALALLQKDAEREAAPVARALKVDLLPYQQDALISLAFNCGGGAIRKSTLVNKLNAGREVEAADEFLKWNKAGGKTSKGLSKRRMAERILFLTREYGANV